VSANPGRVFVCVLLSGILAVAQEAASWQTLLRTQVENRNFEAALALVDTRLTANPGDLEARGWRARLLAWMGRWPEAESEYRRVLEKAPTDFEILAGLSDVLLWQGKIADALAVLDRTPRTSADVLNRRGRLLARLDRVHEARADFRTALRVNPGDREANAGLASLMENPRHELRLGLDADTLNFTGTAAAQAVSLTSRWDARWTTSFTANFCQRFGASAERWTARVNRRLGSRSWVGLGAGAAHDEGVIPRRELLVEAGRGFLRRPSGLIRGIECTFSPQWLWFRDSRVLALAISQVLYLPREWTWSFTAVAARSAFPVTGVEWQAAGSTRLSFPVYRDRMRAHVLFAVGAENFSTADQIGHFSARTWGGGLRYRLTSAQDIGGYFAFQDRSQGRTQTSFGFSYGFRF
jgi:Tfp pilus assembly protein PilF